MRTLSTLCVLLLATAAVVHADDFYTKSSGVTVLTSKNFDSLVKAPNSIWLVEFYAPWCGHCKNLKPEWIAAAKALKGLVKVAAIDCDDAANRPIAGQYGIQGFPTIKLFINGKPQDYQGGRSASDIIAYGKSMIPSHVKQVTASSHDSFLATPADQVHVLLFTNKQTTSPFYRALSLKYKDRVVFGEVRKGEKALLTKYEVTEDAMPLMVAIPASGDRKPVVFNGKFTDVGVGSFLQTLGVEGGAGEEENTLLELADQSCMESHCINQGGLCALLVATKGQKQANPQYTNVMLEVEQARSDSLFHFAWIDSNTQADFLSKAFGLTASEDPRVVVLSARKHRFSLYPGALTVDGVSGFLKDVLSGKVKTAELKSGASLPALAGNTKKCAQSAQEPPQPPPQQQQQEKPKPKEEKKAAGGPFGEGYVTKLTDSTFESLVVKSDAPWMVEFFAPWCGHCQRLAPEWAKAAEKTKGMVRFGTVDCTVETKLASTYGIKGYPTIKVFPGGASANKSPQDYRGAREAKGLADHAFGLLEAREVMPVDERLIGQWLALRPELPRAILFTNKKGVPDMWKALSMAFAGKFGFGIAFEENNKLYTELKVDKVPAVYFMPPPASQEPEKLGASRYDGPLTFEALHQVLAQFIRASTPRQASDDSNAPVPAVVLAKTQKQFEDACVNKLGLCVLAMLPGDELNKGETVLKALAKTHAKKGLNFVIVNKEEEYDFFSVFTKMGLGDAGELVLVNVRKGLVAPYPGVFDEEHISEFVSGVMSGRIKTGKLKHELPKLKGGAEEAAAAAPKKEEAPCGGGSGGDKDDGMCTKPPAKDEL